MDCISQLPDCILSHILTTLTMKDLLKTSVLSRRWRKLWALRRDLNFDIHNVLGSENDLLETGYLIDVLENSTMVRYVDLDLCKDEFVKRVDLFVKNFQGTNIDSFLVEFYLNCEQSNFINQWIILCEFKSSMLKIVSSSLRHLEVSHCYVVSNNIRKDISMSSLDCLRLTSLKYCGRGLESLYINTPMLKSIEHSIVLNEDLYAFSLFATLPELEILHLNIFLTVTTSLKITQPLKHLKQLNFIICWDDSQESDFDLLWISTILQAFPLLQKLSVMVNNPKVFENQKVIKDVKIFSHDEIKVIELGGCVGNWYEIEFAMNVLKYVDKLERMVLSPYWRDESFDWNYDPVWFQNGRERISEKLQGEGVVGQAKLVLI